MKMYLGFAGTWSGWDPRKPLDHFVPRVVYAQSIRLIPASMCLHWGISLSAHDCGHTGKEFSYRSGVATKALWMRSNNSGRHRVRLFENQ